MARPKTDLKDRLLGAADRLFYARGYTNTGISEIVAEARTNKPGLYSYFSGKDDLVRAYVRERDDAMQAIIAARGDEAANLADFFRRWLEYMRAETMEDGAWQNGCAVANFALGTDSNDAEMQKFIRGLGRRWEAGLTLYIRRAIRQGRFESDRAPKTIARRMLLCYHGALTAWKLTGSAEYFDDAIDVFAVWLKNRMS